MKKGFAEWNDLKDIYSLSFMNDVEFAEYIEDEAPGTLGTFGKAFTDSLYAANVTGAGSMGSTPIKTQYDDPMNTGGITGQVKAMGVEFYNFFGNTALNALTTPITSLTNPYNSINSLEEQINKNKAFLDDPLLPESSDLSNPYEKLDKYDDYTGQDVTYVNTDNGETVSPGEYFMEELKTIGGGRLFQTSDPKPSEVDELNDVMWDGMSVSGLIPKDKREVRKRLEVLTKELDAAKKLYAMPKHGREEILNTMYTSVSEFQAQNVLDIKENEKRFAENNKDLQRYYKWQQEEPFSFNWGKEGDDFIFETNVLHPGVARREILNLASTMAQIWTPRGAVTGLSLLNKFNKFSKTGKALSQSNKMLSKLDMMAMVTLEGGHQYNEVYEMALNELNLPPDLANLLASESTIITGLINGPMERLGFNTITKHLGIQKRAKSDFARKFARSRFNIFNRTKVKPDGELVNYDTMLWHIIKSPVPAIAEGITEGYQEGWSLAVQEAIRQGYGGDEMTAMNSLFREAGKTVKSDFWNYALPHFSDIDQIRNSAFAGSLGGGAFGAAGILSGPKINKWRTTKGSIWYDDDSIILKGVNGDRDIFIPDEEGQSKPLAELISEETGLPVTHPEQTDDSFTVAVAALLPRVVGGVNPNAPMLKDILGDKLNADNSELNPTEIVMKDLVKSKKDRNENELVLALANRLKAAGITNLEAHINALNIDDNSKSVLLWNLKNAYSDRLISLAEKQISGTQDVKESYLKALEAKIGEKKLDEIHINMEQEEAYVLHLGEEANIPGFVTNPTVPTSVIENNVIPDEVTEGEEVQLRQQRIAGAQKALEGKDLNNLTDPADVLSQAVLDVAYMNPINIPESMLKQVAIMLGGIDPNIDTIIAKIEEFVLPLEHRTNIPDAIETSVDIPSDIQTVANIHSSKARGKLNIARESEVKYLFKQLRTMRTFLQIGPPGPDFPGTIIDPKAEFRLTPEHIERIQEERIKYDDIVDTAEVLYFQGKYGDANANVEMAIGMLHESAEYQYPEFGISESGEIVYNEEHYPEMIREAAAKEEAEIGGDPLAPIADPGQILQEIAELEDLRDSAFGLNEEAEAELKALKKSLSKAEIGGDPLAPIADPGAVLEQDVPESVFDDMMSKETGQTPAQIKKAIAAQESSNKKERTVASKKVVVNKKQADKAADNIAEILCVKKPDLGDL